MWCGGFLVPRVLCNSESVICSCRWSRRSCYFHCLIDRILQSLVRQHEVRLHEIDCDIQTALENSRWLTTTFSDILQQHEKLRQNLWEDLSWNEWMGWVGGCAYFLKYPLAVKQELCLLRTAGLFSEVLCRYGVSKLVWVTSCSSALAQWNRRSFANKKWDMLKDL